MYINLRGYALCRRPLLAPRIAIWGARCLRFDILGGHGSSRMDPMPQITGFYDFEVILGHVYVSFWGSKCLIIRFLCSGLFPAANAAGLLGIVTHAANNHISSAMVGRWCEPSAVTPPSGNGPGRCLLGRLPHPAAPPPPVTPQWPLLLVRMWPPGLRPRPRLWRIGSGEPPAMGASPDESKRLGPASSRPLAGPPLLRDWPPSAIGSRPSCWLLSERALRVAGIRLHEPLIRLRDTCT